MSGGGVPDARTSGAERADFLAYLARRIANAERVILIDPGGAGEARMAKRQNEIIRDEIKNGFHEGLAE